MKNKRYDDNMDQFLYKGGHKIIPKVKLKKNLVSSLNTGFSSKLVSISVLVFII